MPINANRSVPWDRITAITGIVVAVCALVVSVWQGALTRAHNKLSVMPMLAFELNFDPHGMSGLYLYNRGFGPARIAKITAILDQDTLPPSTFLRQMAFALKEVHPRIVSANAEVSERYLFAGDMITPGDDVLLLGLPAGTVLTDPRGPYRDFFIKRVKILIEYCSFYGDCALAHYPQ